MKYLIYLPTMRIWCKNRYLNQSLNLCYYSTIFKFVFILFITSQNYINPKIRNPLKGNNEKQKSYLEINLSSFYFEKV